MTERLVTPRLAQLYAIRAAVDALVIAEEMDAAAAAMDGAPDPDGCPHCGAPSDLTENVSTIDGTTRRHCTRCRMTFVVGERAAR